MGRPRKIPVEYSDPPTFAGNFETVEDPYAAGRRLKDDYIEIGGKQPPNPPPSPALIAAPPDPPAKSNDRFSIGDVYVSDRGHKVTVVALGESDVTFAFTRTMKGVVENRQRTVPFDLLQFFLKAYHQ